MLKDIGHISFFTILNAGYISASTYFALNKYKYVKDLTLGDIDLFSLSIQKELEPLYTDEDLTYKIFYYQKLKSEDINILKYFEKRLISLLQRQLPYINHIINEIGRIIFIKQYVFAAYLNNEILYREHTKRILSELCKSLRSFIIHYYEYQYVDKSILGTKDSNDNKGVIKYSFSKIDDIIIDEDAVHFSSDKPIVEAIYSLDVEEFTELSNLIKNAISSYTVRTRTCISACGIRMFLVNYLYADEKKLLKIRNFGNKSFLELKKHISELKRLTKDYLENNSYPLTTTIDNDKKAESYYSFESLAEDLGNQKYKLLKNKYTTLLNNSSARVKNALWSSNYTINTFIEDFIINGESPHIIKNIGKKSEYEIHGIIATMKNYIDMLNSQNDIDLQINLLNDKYGNLIDSFAIDYYKENQHLPMFHVLENHIKEASKQKPFTIYEKCKSILKNSVGKSLDELSAEYKLSRERIRQIYISYESLVKEVPDDYSPSYSSFMINYRKLIANKNDWYYLFENVINEDMFYFEDLSKIIDSECNLSHEFCYNIVSYLLKDKFDSFTGPYSSAKDNKWVHSFFISNELTNTFDFNIMKNVISDLESSYDVNITHTIEELIIDTFYNSWKEFEPEKTSRISYVASKLLINEFSIFPDWEYKYTIKSKKGKKTIDYVYDILKESGKPMSIYDIKSRFDTLWPKTYDDIDITRLKNLIKNDDRINPVRRYSLYALAEWDFIHYGTIREILVEYLSGFKLPRKLSDILSYLNTIDQFDEHNIRSTLGSGSQFIVLPRGYFGLSDKKYPESYYKTDFENAIDSLESFIIENKHFPFSTSYGKEQELYKWFTRYKRKYNSLKNKEKQLIDKILTKYKDYPQTQLEANWFNNAERFQKFVEINHRKPQKNKYEEHYLATWFEKSLNDFADNNLTPQQVSKLIKLTNLL